MVVLVYCLDIGLLVMTQNSRVFSLVYLSDKTLLEDGYARDFLFQYVHTTTS